MQEHVDQGGNSGFFLNGMHTYYLDPLAVTVGDIHPPRKETADGPQEWEWGWVYYPRS